VKERKKILSFFFALFFCLGFRVFGQSRLLRYLSSRSLSSRPLFRSINRNSTYIFAFRSRECALISGAEEERRVVYLLRIKEWERRERFLGRKQ